MMKSILIKGSKFLINYFLEFNKDFYNHQLSMAQGKNKKNFGKKGQKKKIVDPMSRK